MQKLCANEDSCLHFFPGMGFRPAVHVVQRDQYGDHPVLVVGDDSPLEGKVPPGWMITDMPFDPYAPLGGAPGMGWMASATRAASGYPVPGGSTWGGSSGGPGGPNRPGQPSGPAGPGDPGNPGGPSGTTPGTPVQGVPPIWGDSSQPPSVGDTSTQPPQSPDLPPLQPVPGPEAGILLLSVLVILTMAKRAKRIAQG